MLQPYWAGRCSRRARVCHVGEDTRSGGTMHDREAYARALDEVVARVETSLERGLSSEEAGRRLETLGANELAQEERVSPIRLFLAQFKNTLIIILLVATVLSAVLGEIVDAAIIAVIVLFCAVLSFVQEYRADNALKALKKMLAPTISVLRDGARRASPRASSSRATSCCWKRGSHSRGRAPCRDPLAQVRRGAADRRIVPRREVVEPASEGCGRRRPPQYRLRRNDRDVRPRQGDRDLDGHAHRIRQDRRAGVGSERRAVAARKAHRGGRPLAGNHRDRRLRHHHRASASCAPGWATSSISSSC